MSVKLPGATDAIQQLLSNVSTLTHSLADIRNCLTQGLAVLCGEGPRAKGLNRRRARLGVDAVTHPARFLLDTHRHR